MSGLTGDKNLDMEILMQLRDDELTQVCKVNKYINAICESEIFWLKRVIRRIEIARDSMIRIDNKIKENAVDIDYENLKTFKEFYGFDTYKEINDYFNKFLPNTSYQLFFSTIKNPHVTDKVIIDYWYIINKEKLPMYIDYKKLMQYLRRERQISYYNISNDRALKIPYLPSDIPGIEYRMDQRLVPKVNIENGRKLEITRLID